MSILLRPIPTELVKSIVSVIIELKFPKLLEKLAITEHLNTQVGDRGKEEYCCFLKTLENMLDISVHSRGMNIALIH